MDEELIKLKQELAIALEKIKTLESLCKDVDKLKEDWIEQKVLNERISGKLDSINDGIKNINQYMAQQGKQNEDKTKALELEIKELKESQRWNWVDFIKTKAIPYLIILGLGAYIVSQALKK